MKCTELSYTWEAVSCADTQELSSIFWKPKVHYRVHKSHPLVPILSYIDPVHNTPSHLTSIYLILSAQLRIGLPNGLFSSVFPTNILHAFLSSPIRATWPTVPILLAKNRSYEALHYAAFSNLLSLHIFSVEIFSSASCSQTPSVYVPPIMSETKFHAHKESQPELQLCVF
jgi:hypothetical protein